MNNEDRLIELQAKLDELKSKGNMNSDIDKIQRQLNTLKIQAVIDPQAISRIKKQLEAVSNQKITISNININQSKMSKSALQAGQQIGRQMQQGIEQELKPNADIANDYRSLTAETQKVSTASKTAVETKKELDGNMKTLSTVMGAVIGEKQADSIMGALQKFKEAQDFVSNISSSLKSFGIDTSFLDKFKNLGKGRKCVPFILF